MPVGGRHDNADDVWLSLFTHDASITIRIPFADENSSSLIVARRCSWVVPSSLSPSLPKVRGTPPAVQVGGTTSSVGGEGVVGEGEGGDVDTVDGGGDDDVASVVVVVGGDPDVADGCVLVVGIVVVCCGAVDGGVVTAASVVGGSAVVEGGGGGTEEGRVPFGCESRIATLREKLVPLHARSSGSVTENCTCTGSLKGLFEAL